MFKMDDDDGLFEGFRRPYSDFELTPIWNPDPLKPHNQIRRSISILHEKVED